MRSVSAIAFAATLPAMGAFGQETPKSLSPPGGKLVMEDFEWCEEGRPPKLWTQWGKPEGMTLSVAPVERPDGGGRSIAMTLSGTGVKGGGDAMQIEASRDLPIPALAGELLLTLTGDAPLCRVHVRVRDAEGETFGFPFAAPEGGEWKVVRVVLDEAGAEYHYGGDGNGKMAWPLFLQSVGVSDDAGAPTGAEFSVSIDEIAAVVPECKPVPIFTGDETELFWQLAGENLGDTKISLGTDEEAGDRACVWVDYAWGPGDPRPNSYAELILPTPLETGEGTIFAWVKGDGSRVLVTFRLTDAKGEFWQITNHNSFMLWTGWRCVILDVIPGDKRCWISNWNGDGVLDPPLAFHSILFDDWTGPERLDEIPPSPPQGRVAVGPVWYVGWGE